MLERDHSPIAPELRAAVHAHYQRVAPLLARHFTATPIVFATFPHGFDAPPQWHGPLNPRYPTPGDETTIAVPSAHGMHRYRALDAATVERLAVHAQAIEFHGWSPQPNDPTHARFARILLELDADAPAGHLNDAALQLRARLRATGCDAIALLMGTNGIALWIPLAQPRDYPSVRAWLHDFCNAAIAADPRRFSGAPDTHALGRIHLHVGSNAPGRYSALPYSLRGDAALRVCAPVTWDELPHLLPDAFDAANFAARLAARGDVFAAELARIGAGATLTLAPSAERAHGRAIEPHGDILQAALTVLQDGVARDAKSILAQALARGLVPPNTKVKYVYTSLLEYIVRTAGHGHRPLIVQDEDRSFRLNVPPDSWPAVATPPQPPLDATRQATIDRLTQTMRGSDPAAFELAVCDAFAQLGFSATHVGGNDGPDGYADAQLGPLGYRAMLECKSGARDVSSPDCVEASKFRDPYRAQFCALIGPGFSEDTELAQELQTHGVSAWTVDDLATLLRVRSNPQEMRALFAPGYVADALGPLLWERVHGAAKRVRLICEYVREAGWAAQVAATHQGPPANAPHLTLDAAMLLVDERLAALGTNASCTRDEVAAALAYLSNPRVGQAVWTDGAQRAIVILGPLEPTAPATQ